MKQIYGAVDIGSNGIRCAIHEQGSAADLLRRRYSVRLGHKVFISGELGKRTQARAAKTIKIIQTRFKRAGVTDERWVCTSAVRSANNGKAFLDAVKREAGVTLEVISGDEESRLITSAVAATRGSKPRPRAIFDLGGGSLEVNLMKETGELEQRLSMPLGTVRYLETFDLWGRIKPKRRRMLECNIMPWLDLVLPNGFDLSDEDCVACGGNPEAILEILQRSAVRNGRSIPVTGLRALLADLLPMRITERISRYGINRNRAEVIGIAGLFLDVLATKLKIKRFLVPGVGIREGILQDFITPAR